MISIIIPTLNEANYLPKLLEDLKNRPLPQHEIIVSDGHSKDNTVKIARQMGCKIVTHPKKAKKGPAIQRNEGAKIAKGELLLFLDADTQLPKHFFKLVLREFKQRKLDVAGFYFEFNNPGLKYKINSKIIQWGLFLFHRIRPVSVGAAILVKKSYHQKVNGFNSKIKIGEDHDYAARIKKAGGKYGLIRSKRIIFCTRRMEQEGFLKVFLEWKIMSFILFGPLKHNSVNYKFGEYDH